MLWGVPALTVPLIYMADSARKIKFLGRQHPLVPAGFYELRVKTVIKSLGGPRKRRVTIYCATLTSRGIFLRALDFYTEHIA